MPEPQVRAGRPADVEGVRVVVGGGVAVGPGDAHQDLLVGGDRDAVELHRLGGDAEGRVRHRRREPDELLDRSRQQGRLVVEEPELVGTVEEGDDAVADEARGRVVAGDDELEEAREQLLPAQAALLVSSAVTSTPTRSSVGLGARVDQVLEVRHDLR